MEERHNIILIGYMGCGKTSIGTKLARILEYDFIDTDAYIEQSEGRLIRDLFETEGEPYFRNLETKALQTFYQTVNHCIISTGGGMPIREENVALLKKMGQVIYLKASAEEIYHRVKNDTSRPLLLSSDPRKKIQDMMKERCPIYERAADLIVNTDGRSFYSIIEEILHETVGKENKR